MPAAHACTTAWQQGAAGSDGDQRAAQLLFSAHMCADRYNQQGQLWHPVFMCSAPAALQHCALMRLEVASLHVLLLLQAQFRGYFVPPRPEKNAVEGQRMSDAFVEERRAGLQKYLQRLAAHPAIGCSEVRGRLEFRGAMRWAAAAVIWIML